MALAGVLALAAAAARADEDLPLEPREPGVERIPVLLGDLVDELATDDRDALARAIAALGDPVRPAILDALAEGRLPRSAPPEESEVEPLSTREREALLLAAGRLGREPWIELLDGTLGPEVREARLLAVLELAEVVGDGRDLELVLRATTSIGTPPAPPVLSAAERALTAVLEADAAALGAARRACLTAPADVRHLVVRAAGALQSAQARDWLLALLGADRELDRILLSELSRVAGRPLPALDESDTARVRDLLTDEDMQLRRSAARACAALQDFAALPALIDLLEDPEDPVRREAWHALKRVTGMALPASPDRWRSWLAQETRWYEEEAPPLLARLDNAQPRVAAVLLDELASHRFQRHRTAERIAEVLDSDDATVRRGACIALRRLGSNRVCAELVALLGDAEEGVAEEALRTLRHVSRQELPADLIAWSEWLADGSS